MNYRNTMIAVLIVATLLFSLFTIVVSSSEGLTLSAKSAALYDPSTKTFILEKNSSARLPMASTTKIMTALVALEHAGLDDTVIIDERAQGIEGSSAYLTSGDKYTLEEMLYALMLASANDAAVAIACTVCGSVEDFVHLMNEKCDELSLENTHFENPSGLDADGHYTTAKDLAILAAVALENDTFRTLCATHRKSIGNDSGTRHLVNHNKLLKQYQGAIGVKTGYTKKCGRCLVSAAERNGVSLVAVTLDAPDDWQDHKRMLDFGFDNLTPTDIAKSGEYNFKIPILFSDNEFVMAQNISGFKVPLRKDAKINYDVQIPPYITLTVKKGDIVGKIRFTVDEKLIGGIDIVSTENYENINKRGLFSKFSIKK